MSLSTSAVIDRKERKLIYFSLSKCNVIAVEILSLRLVQTENTKRCWYSVVQVGQEHVVFGFQVELDFVFFNCQVDFRHVIVVTVVAVAVVRFFKAGVVLSF